ncbi:MAG TPA: hypothetical protein VD710_05820 [Nitrososphaeraceae archaeon]|nr:hypothetical protein [Nitrososphaeraceae archaeon]
MYDSAISKIELADLSTSFMANQLTVIFDSVESLTRMALTKLLLVIFVASAALLISGAIQNSVMANQYSQQEQGYSHHDKMMMRPASYALGTIASLQNDENGNPIWIVSGHYKGSISMNNKTQDGNATGSLPNATLYAKFSMVMTNGSAMHDHRIYNFTLTGMSMPNNSTTVFNGTATITMRQGPVPDVPLSIKAMEDNVVSIWVDPTKVQNHFGNTPIFGTIEKLIEVHK